MVEKFVQPSMKYLDEMKNTKDMRSKYYDCKLLYDGQLNTVNQLKTKPSTEDQRQKAQAKLEQYQREKEECYVKAEKMLKEIKRKR